MRLPLHSPGRPSESDDATATNRTPTSKYKYENLSQALRAVAGSHTVCPIKETDISILARQKSFAGVLTYTLGDASAGELKGMALAKDPVLRELASCHDPPPIIPLCTCYWRRDIDYQPPSTNLDVGICVSSSPRMDHTGSIDFRETGQDGSYAEGWWHRLEHTKDGPFMALELMEERKNGTKRIGYWIRAGNRFAYAIGRPFVEGGSIAPLNDMVGQTLQEALADLSEEKQLALLGNYVAVAGEIEDETQSWRI